jgi:KaiC/GvpD/RAD55 family RecA-like ATPase
MDRNDPNEYLENRDTDSFWNAYWRITKYVPSGILGSGGIRDKMIEYVMIEKIPLPPFMSELQNLMAGGIPLGVIVAIASASGSGKTTIVDECSYYWYFNSPHKLGVLTLEADSAQYGINLLSRHIGNKINLIESPEDKVDFLNQPEVIEASNKLFLDDEGNDRFYLVEERDGEIDTIMDLTENLIISCGCRVIVFDPVSDVLEGATNEEQAKFYKWMKGMTKEYTVTFILISHVRKSSSGTKANSRGADINEEDFFGSSSIFKSSACNLLFSRDKEAEDEFERNVTKMKATKIRWTGRTSPFAGEYYYENATHRMHDKKKYLEANPSKGPKSKKGIIEGTYSKVATIPKKVYVKREGLDSEN